MAVWTDLTTRFRRPSRVSFKCLFAPSPNDEFAVHTGRLGASDFTVHTITDLAYSDSDGGSSIPQRNTSPRLEREAGNRYRCCGLRSDRRSGRLYRGISFLAPGTRHADLPPTTTTTARKIIRSPALPAVSRHQCDEHFSIHPRVALRVNFSISDTFCRTVL